VSGVAPIAREPDSAVWDSDLDRLLDHGFGGVGDVTDKSEPMAGANDFGSIGGQAMMGDDTSLEVADVVGGVVHQLDVSDAALMGLLEAFEFSLEEVQPFDIAHDRRLSRRVRRFQIG
jgi:hypothetical protein